MHLHGGAVLCIRCDRNLGGPPSKHLAQTIVIGCLQLCGSFCFVRGDAPVLAKGTTR
jgi:hypothetical protein